MSSSDGVDQALDLQLVHLRSTSGGADPAAAAVLGAARAHGVLGAVVEQTASSTAPVPAVVLALPVDPAGRLLQLLRGEVVPGPLASVVVDRVARELGSVAEEVGEVEESAPDALRESALSGDQDAAADHADVVVSAFSTRRAVDRELALEVALLVDAEVVLGREDPWTLAVHGPAGGGLDLQPWPGAMRPVVTFGHRPGEVLLVEAHLPRERGRRGGDAPAWDLRRRSQRRALEHALPSWSWAVLPQRAEPLVDSAAHPDLDDDVRRQLLDLQGQPEPTHLAEVLGLDADQRDRLAAVLGEPLTPAAPHAVVQALGLPAAVALLSTGELDPRDLQQAVGAQPHGFLGTVAEGLLSRPEGSGWLSRLRRLDHDRPWLSAVFIAGEVALGAAMAARALGAFGGPLPTVWAVLLGIGAVLCALDAAGNAVLLATLRRRRRAALDAEHDAEHDADR